MVLGEVSRARQEPASHVARAKALLAVADGQSYVAAAHGVGRQNGDWVRAVVARFNREGIAALQPGHVGGPGVRYGAAEQTRIVAEARRTPQRAAPPPAGRPCTAVWSLTTLQRALRRAPDGLPGVSTYTIWWVLRDAGWSWQRSRTWCDTGTRPKGTRRKRKAGTVTVIDPDAAAKKLIEQAYQEGERLGLAVWNQDEAGPYQTIPQPGSSWRPQGEPVRQPHEYLPPTPAGRPCIAKPLTLFHPATGVVQMEGVTACPNTVLHGWLQEELAIILAALSEPAVLLNAEANRACWTHWQEGLLLHPTLPDELPPLRLLLILDNLAGHKTPSFVSWLFAQGIMPLYTPLEPILKPGIVDASYLV
jgi:hypothetical protein